MNQTEHSCEDDGNALVAVQVICAHLEQASCSIHRQIFSPFPHLFSTRSVPGMVVVPSLPLRKDDLLRVPLCWVLVPNWKRHLPS